MNSKRPALSDLLIGHFDRALKTLVPHSNQASVPSPAEDEVESSLSEAQINLIAGLMRVNHTGEVCAQGLYQGQALTARRNDLYQSMEKAADEEIDHLVWCEKRLSELNAQTSLLNPAWYLFSYSMGAIAGAFGDKHSLGFVAATEQQVCQHLEDHLQQIGDIDPKSKAIITQMLADEARHAEFALSSGGNPFSDNAKIIMSQIAKIMTKSSFHL